MPELDTKAGIAIGAIIALIMGIFSQTIFAKQEQVIIQNGIPNTENNNNENPNIACSYLVFRNEGTNTTNAKDCSTGMIVNTNKDSYTVIEQLINSQKIKTNHGGLIFVTQGNYSLSHRIDVNATNIQIKGVGYGGVHLSSNYIGSTRFYQAPHANLAQIFFLNCNGCAVPTNTILSDFLIDGNNSTNTQSFTGILVQGDYDDTLQNLQVFQTTSYGITMQDCHACTEDNIYVETGNQAFHWIGGVNPSVMSGGRFTKLYANNFDSSTSYTLEGNVQGNVFSQDIGQDDKGRCFYMFTNFGFAPSQNTFVGNECYQLSGHNGLYGFDLFGARDNTFTGNIVYNMGQASSNTYDGFILHTLSGLSAINNTFTGNIIISSGVTNHMRYAFNEVDANQDFNVYIGNNIAGMATAAIRTQGIHSIAKNNLGYNPVASSTVTAGASVWTYTNTDGYTEQMILQTVNGQTAETCNGIAVTNPITIGQTCNLGVGQSMTSTWAGNAPLYKKVPND